jgi:hypothetical protein
LVKVNRINIALFCAGAALFVSLFGVTDLFLVVQNNKGSLCDQKTYAQNRYNDSLAYFKTHPNGVPALDLSRPALQRSIDAQKAYLATFDDLDC